MAGDSENDCSLGSDVNGTVLPEPVCAVRNCWKLVAGNVVVKLGIVKSF